MIVPCASRPRAHASIGVIVQRERNRRVPRVRWGNIDVGLKDAMARQKATKQATERLRESRTDRTRRVTACLTSSVTDAGTGLGRESSQAATLQRLLELTQTETRILPTSGSDWYSSILVAIYISPLGVPPEKPQAGPAHQGHHRLRSQKQTYLAQTRNSPSRPAILLTALSVPRCLSFPQPLDNASCSSLILQPTFALPGHFQPGSGFHLRRPISLPKSPRSAHLLTGPGQHGPLPASYNGPYPPAGTP